MAEDNRPDKPSKKPEPGHEWWYDPQKKKWVEWMTGLPKPDIKDKKTLAEEYGYALNVIYANDELRKLFEEALNAKKGQWTPEKFKAGLKNTKWYQNHSQSWRDAWVAQKTGGEDWKTQVLDARRLVRERANALGIKISDKQIQDLGKRFLFEGWMDPKNSGEFDAALAKFYNKKDFGSGGEAQQIIDRLKQMAHQYGVKFNDGWFAKANRSIFQQQSTVETWEQEIKDRAKSKYQPIAAKIDQGFTTREALDPYLTSMQEILEIPADQVNLNDPLISKALRMDDPEGEGLMSLYDYQTELRKDPRWQSTGNGRRTIMDSMQDFMRSMGLGA